MDDGELERLAVQEILREASSTNGQEQQKKALCANKTFLGRTINSVIAHNKRENDRTQKNCRNKLKEIEARRRKRLNLPNDNKTANESYSTSNAFDNNSSSDSECDKKAKKRRRKSHSKSILEEENRMYAKEELYSQYFDQLAAYALASKSYYQVGKWLCYQTLLAGTELSEQKDVEKCINMNVRENCENMPICLTSSDDNIDANFEEFENLELNFMKDGENLDTPDADASFLENALECQLIDDELSAVQNSHLDANETIELSDSSAEADGETSCPDKNISIDLTSD